MKLEQVSDSLFCRVYQVNSIYIAKVLERKERGMAYGSPDIQIVNIMGNSMMITRKQLITGFKALNGKKIKMRNLKNNKGYCIMGNDHYEMFALKVPAGRTVEYGFNTKTAKPGSWLVCSDDGCGGINKQIAVCMSSQQFKKIFKVTAINFEREFKNFESDKLNKQKAMDTQKNAPITVSQKASMPVDESNATWQVVSINEETGSIRYRIESSTQESRLVSEKALKAMVMKGEVKGLSYNDGANSFIGWEKLNSLPVEK